MRSFKIYIINSSGSDSRVGEVWVSLVYCSNSNAIVAILSSELMLPET